MDNTKIKYTNQWTGYKNYRDITNLGDGDITAGSKNIFIEDGAKLSVRGGTRFYGTEGTIGVQTDPYWSIAHRVHSKYDKFVNGGGNPTPLRIYYSGNNTTGDVIQVNLPEFASGVAQSTKKWYTASQTVSPATPLISKHRWYFAEWWDNLAQQPLLIFVSGNKQIKSWTLGYAPIVTVGATSIVTTEPLSSLGFVNAAGGGSDTIIINGTAYITDGDFTGTTTDIPLGTTGISIDDVAFSEIENFNSPDDFAYDYCSMVNNQVYYGDWKQRNVLVSWSVNQNERFGFPTYQGTSGLNDLIFDGTYTGSTTSTFEITIDDVRPGIDTEIAEFVSRNGNTSATGSFDVSGYTGGTSQNEYELRCIYTRVWTGVTASMSPAAGDPAWVNQIFVGQTSGAIGVAVDGTYALSFVVGGYMLSGEFEVGETIVGQATGASVEIAFNQESNAFQLYKNGNQYTASSPFNVPTTNSWQVNLDSSFIGASTRTLTDGIDFTFTMPMNHLPGDTYKLTIQKKPTQADRFSWTKDGVKQASRVAITGGVQNLSDGVTIEFVETSGHDRDDTWTIKAFPKIDDGYRNFTFSTPDRLPIEGNIINLDSNFWTMYPQENAMYINGSAGEYYEVTQNTIGLNTERLKSEPQFKALYPYLLGYMENFLVSIIQEKSFNKLGRQEFLELPQMTTLSDEVKTLFETSDWEDGDILYAKTKTFFTLPKEGVVIVYDNFMKYFHAPMEFGRRVSSISFIDNKIIGHSYERNESYELFTDELNDLGQYAIESSIVTPYFDEGERFNQKSTNAIAIDGYMIGNPELKWAIHAGVGGCDGIPKGTVNPQVCLPVDTASLGKSPLGFHGLGNSPTDIIPHFKYGKTFPPTSYYLRNIEISCSGLEQRWSIVSMGISVDKDKINNSNMFNIN